MHVCNFDVFDAVSTQVSGCPVVKVRGNARPYCGDCGHHITAVTWPTTKNGRYGYIAEHFWSGPLWCLDSPMEAPRNAWGLAYFFILSGPKKLYFNHWECPLSYFPLTFKYDVFIKPINEQWIFMEADKPAVGFSELFVVQLATS